MAFCDAVGGLLLVAQCQAVFGHHEIDQPLHTFVLRQPALLPARRKCLAQPRRQLHRLRYLAGRWRGSIAHILRLASAGPGEQQEQTQRR